MASVEQRAAKKIRGASVKYAERLWTLLTEFQIANGLARVPLELLAERPARYRQQVMARVEHWSVKAAAAESRLLTAMGEKDCETEEADH